MQSFSAHKMETECCFLSGSRDLFMQLRESATTGLMPVGVNFHRDKTRPSSRHRVRGTRSSLIKGFKLRASLVDGSSIGADVPAGSNVRDYGVFSSLIVDNTEKTLPSYQKVYDVVLKQVEQLEKTSKKSSGGAVTNKNLLEEAYTRCGEICAEYAKTFYLGTMLMTPERRKAIWAIYVWCRRTDELVDGPNASHITPMALDRWEQRLEDLFQGKPFDMLDGALADTVSKYPVDIQPFRDMIEGMRLDLVKSRYTNFDELYLYCYYVAGTVGLMSVPVMGISPDSKASTETVYNAALALGIANQLTNILRDVGEDAARGRIYLPQDELAKFGLSEEDIFAGKVTDKWRAFMKDQIRRARMFFKQAELGVLELDKDSRWPVWASLSLYQQILDSIEANDYDNFKKRAYVNKWKKLAMLPLAYVRALTPQKLSTISTMAALK